MSGMEAVGTKISTPSNIVEVEEVCGQEEFAKLQPEWNALLDQTQDEPFFRHEFLSTWMKHFAPSMKLRVWLGRGPRGDLVAALPLVEEATTLCGFPVVQLSAPANSHSCRFDMMAMDADEAALVFLDALQKDDRWDLLRLVDIPEQGEAWSLLRLAQAKGFPVGAWESQKSPYLLLPKSLGPSSLHKNSRHASDLRRRRRRLVEKGRVTVECVRTAQADKVEEAFALERSGWKGERGTAMSQMGSTQGFYSDLAHWAASENALAIYFLRLEGQAIAFDFGLRYRRGYYSLKVGYDEQYAACSPGQLLTEDTLVDCVKQGVGMFDFLGDDTPSKRDWTQKVRPHHWLYLFRNSTKGRMLYQAKFRLMPAAKKLLGKSDVPS